MITPPWAQTRLYIRGIHPHTDGAYREKHHDLGSSQLVYADMVLKPDLPLRAEPWALPTHRDLLSQAVSLALEQNQLPSQDLTSPVVETI